MKMKVSKDLTEQKNSGNSNHKYTIRQFKCHLPGDVAVAVAVDVDIAVAGVFLFCAVAALIF